MPKYHLLAGDTYIYIYRERERENRKNLEKEELLTDKNRKQISEEFITDN